MSKKRFLMLLMLLIVVMVYFIVYEIGYQQDKSGASPVIKFESVCIETTVAEAEQDLLSGVSAYDAEDGDVTDSLLVESISAFVEPGKCLVTYVAFDSNNHVTSSTREMLYTDYTSPKFTLTAPLKFVYDSNLNIARYISAYDCIDGDISDRIKFSMVELGDSLANTGIHPVLFTVSNSKGEVVELRTNVEIYTTTYLDKLSTPQIHLNEYLIYAKMNDIIDFNSYIKYVKLDDEMISGTSSLINEINIETDKSELNMKAPGVYSVTYSVTNDTGYTGTTKLVIVVEE